MDFFHLFLRPFIGLTLFNAIIIGIIAYIMCITPPKKINSFIGYRTKRSMRSQEAWNFSQVYSSQKMGRAMFLLSMVGLLGIFLPPLSEGVEVALGVLFLLMAIFIPIWQTEKALKKKFD